MCFYRVGTLLGLADCIPRLLRFFRATRVVARSSSPDHAHGCLWLPVSWVRLPSADTRLHLRATVGSCDLAGIVDFAPPLALVDGSFHRLSLFYGPWCRALGSWPIIFLIGEISPVSLDSGRLSDQLECSHRGSPK